MKCPHCRISFRDEPTETLVGSDAQGSWSVVKRLCPSCNRLILSLKTGRTDFIRHKGEYIDTDVETFVYPRAASRPACAPEVPKGLAEDYQEASLVIADSPKASAALSRRCLQHLLREHAGVKKANLVNEIQEVIDSRSLPTPLAGAIDAIRNTGNFAAHPAKSSTTGEIIEVEPGEAEWNLDVLEMLFDFYFVQPALLAQKREALNKKLSAAGKPPMK
jgi:hypothetical protein